MAQRRIGVTAMGGGAPDIVQRVQDLERLGIPAAWLTTVGVGHDGLTLFAAAAVRTERILMGTSITPTYPRHPLTTFQQLQVLTQLAPGRFRLGLGPSSKASIEPTYGIRHTAPLTNLREYIHIVKSLLQDGAVDFDGVQYHAHAKLQGPPPKDVPVMASALRRKSFELCGEVADGAISWVCPGAYLRDVALPAMQAGAKKAGRETPPLIVHVPVCVHGNVDEARAAANEQLAFFPRSSFYQAMFIDAGYPEAKSGAWSARMLDDVVAMGNEDAVATRLRQLFSWGATEVIAHPIPVGADRRASIARTVDLLAAVNRAL